MKYDYVSVGFFTFDCLGWPFEGVPEGGGTYLIDDLTIAVSGAAGAAVIISAMHGNSCLAVGGLGKDLMGDWVKMRVESFGIDVSGLQRISGVPTSSSIVTTRRDGSRPALHMKGATGAFVVDPADFDRVTDTKVFHLGGVGLMDAMDGPRNAALIRHARERGAITTVDVFAGSPADLPDVEAVLPWTDYFIPSIEEAEALSGISDLERMAEFFLSKGVGACIFTMGADGAYYRDKNGTSFVVPAYDIPVRCTCGCGDSFNAGLGTALIRGFAAQEAVRFAQATSAMTAMGLGSQGGLRSFAETLEFAQTAPTRASAKTMAIAS